MAACFSFGDLTGGDATTSGGTDGGGTDVTADDRAAPDDGGGGADTSMENDGATTPFCVSQPDAAFCADFDESTDPSTGFTSLYQNDAGILQYDDTQYASPPASIAAGSGPLSNGDTAHAALVKKTGITATGAVTLDLEIRVDKLATSGSVVEGLALVFNGASRSSIQLNVKKTSAEVGEEVVVGDGGTKYMGHPFPTNLAVGTWTHLRIVVSFASLNRNVTVLVDGTTVVDHVALSAAFTNGPLDLYLGNAYSPAPSDGSSIHYDSVALFAR